MKLRVALFVFASFANAHSWIHCSDYRGDVGTYEPENCFAHPRPLARNPPLYPEQGGFGVDQGANEQEEICQSTIITENPNYPHANYQRGQRVTLAWPSKNHVAATCTNRFIPDTSLELFVAARSASPTFTNVVPGSWTDLPHERHTIDFQGFQNCPRFCDNMDKSLCTGSFTVPDLPDGEYTFQWRWVFNEDTPAYVSCFEATISGNDPNPAPTNTPATTQPVENPVATPAPVENPVATPAPVDNPVATPAPVDNPVATPAPVENPVATPAPVGNPGVCANALHEQCGGDNFTGETCCPAGLTCFKQHQWYSQCLTACPPTGWDCSTGVATPAPVDQPAGTPAPVDQPAGTPAPVELPAGTPAPVDQPSGDSWEGLAKTTRYWDCCKPSCSWKSNAPANNPFINNSPVSTITKSGGAGDPNAANVCSGGGDMSKPIVYAKPDQQPFTIDGVLYGFAAAGGLLSGCCACYELEFTDSCIGGCTYQGQLQGKRMIVQVTNTGSDLGQAHFDLQIPGGGFGIFNGCSAGETGTNGPAQFDEPTSNWGQRFGGISSKAQCSGLPTELQGGCNWRFDDFLNSDNPAVNYRQVRCPAVLTDKSGCRLTNEVDRVPGTSNPAPATPAPVTPATPAPVTPATPAPVTPATPAPVTPATPAPVTPATPSPVTPATPTPVTPATPAPVTPATPAPVTPATPAPVTPATPAPVTPETPAPVTPVTPAPVTPATPAPVTPATPAPVTPATPAPVGGACSAEWQPCGGQNWPGARCCADGLVCYQQHKWYSQCRRPGRCPPSWDCAASAPAPAPPASEDTAPVCTNGEYQKCGGSNYSGPNCCSAGLVCYQQSRYYAQCLKPGKCPRSWTCRTLRSNP